MFVNKGLVDKNTSGSRINEILHREGLKNVSNFKDNRKVQRSSTSIKSTDNRV